MPEYTPEELQQSVPVEIRYTDSNGRRQSRFEEENPIVLRHAMIMGNSILPGKDGSFVVGLPYAWVGESYGAAFQFDNERRIGTIGKIEFDLKRGQRLLVPKNQEYRDVIGLSSKGGSIWGSKELRVSSEDDPVRNLYAGTSMAKGKNYYTKLLYLINHFFLNMEATHVFTF